MKLRTIGAWVCMVLLLMAISQCSKEDKSGSRDRKVNFSDSTVAATVNGQAIFYQERDLAVKQFLLRLGKDPDFFVNQQKDTAVYRQALDWLISVRLLAQEANKSKIKIEPHEVDLAVNNFKRTFPSEQKFLEYLTQNRLTMEKFTNNLTDELKVQKLLDQNITSKIAAVTDQDALQYYNEHGDRYLQPEQIRVHHILFKITNPKDEKQVNVAESKARRILEKIKKGSNFEDMARQYSDDPSAFKGGDLGFFAQGDMIKEFEDAAFALKAGEVSSNLVKTQLGFHIIKLDEKKSSLKIPFDEVKLEILNQLKQERSNSVFEKYVNELKTKAKIKIKKAA